MTTTWGWRIPSIIQGVPALLSVCMVLLLPESPRFLISKDRHSEALAVLARCHGNGNPNDELVQAEFNEISDIIRIEAEAANKGISQLWSTPANRKRMFIIICVGVFGQWSGRILSQLLRKQTLTVTCEGNGLVSYYLSKVLSSIGIQSQEKQTLINGILTIVNYITSVLAAFAVSRIGRRKMFNFSTLGMFFTFSSLTACIAVYNKNSSVAAANGALGFVFIFYTCFNIGFNPLLYMYPVSLNSPMPHTKYENCRD
jgi:MFS family permease